MRNANTMWRGAVLGIASLALLAGCQKKPAADAPKAEVAATPEPSASRPSEGIVSMADGYIEEALSRPIDKLYIEAKASQSNEARFRLGLALLAGRQSTAIKDKDFVATPAMKEANYWLQRAKPAADAKASPSTAASAGSKDETPLTAYVFQIGVECVADLKDSLKTPSAIAIDQAKDSCWGAPAYERYKTELAKHP